jgi:hypothetical protein
MLHWPPRFGTIHAMKRLWSALFPLLLACSGNGAIVYPDVKLDSSKLDVVLEDHRAGKIAQIKAPRALERDETETYAEVFPTDRVVSHIRERLHRLQSSGSTPLLFLVSVERADATLFSHYTSEFVRYDVTLRVEVRTEKGQMLNRGTTSAWRKIPKEEATDTRRTETHVEAALAAFDQYFADEDRLEAINVSLAAAEKSQ